MLVETELLGAECDPFMEKEEGFSIIRESVWEGRQMKDEKEAKR